MERIVSRAQDSVTSPLLERIMSLEQSTNGVRGRLDELALNAKKTGSGGFTNVFMILVMVVESILLLVMFMKQRRTEKYDKMW